MDHTILLSSQMTLKVNVEENNDWSIFKHTKRILKLYSLLLVVFIIKCKDVLPRFSCDSKASTS